MKKTLRLLPILFSLFSFHSVFSQLQPFEGCPGVSVAVTRPGFNAALAPNQIYLIDDTTGAVQAIGDPINLQINAFGLNNQDGFLYGMHQTYNVVNPFLTRVGKNGHYENVGTITGPDVGRFKTALINTAAGTIDDDDNYYFTVIVINLQNITMPPELYSGKIEHISKLREGDRPLNSRYRKINAGTCVDELLIALANPLTGVLQDIAFNPADGRIYTYVPGINGTGGKIAWYDPGNDTPSFTCIDPSQPNVATADLSGLFFNGDSVLYMLTTDGKYYNADITAGTIQLVTQTTLPLENNNLRGDMASCVGIKRLVPFDDCPGVSVAVTRPGINSTGGPHQIYIITPSTGAIIASGHPIDLQINAFGLNSKDGFLYAMHESSNVFAPTLARVDKNGDYADLNTIPGPPAGNGFARIINTAAATMDGNDNYYFTAVVVDTAGFPSLPRLYLGTIKNVSKLEVGEDIRVRYDRVFLGDCLDEVLQSLSNPANGLFQDIVYNPDNGRIYTYIQRNASPASGKLASLRPGGRFIVMDCINRNGNPATQDLSGMHADDGRLYILTIDGKYYRANPNNGEISLVTQTALPLLSNNLRGDMASCVRKGNHGRDADNDDDDNRPLVLDENTMRIAPNPVQNGDMSVSIQAPVTSTVEMRIIDANGDIKQVRKLNLLTGDNLVKVPVTDLQKGVFALVVTYPSGVVQASKFIKL